MLSCQVNSSPKMALSLETPQPSDVTKIQEDLVPLSFATEIDRRRSDLVEFARTQSYDVGKDFGGHRGNERSLLGTGSELSEDRQGVGRQKWGHRLSFRISIAEAGTEIEQSTDHLENWSNGPFENGRNRRHLGLSRTGSVEGR